MIIRDEPTSTYREFPPPPALAGHVLCVWCQVIGGGAGVHRHRVLPDGCADVVWIGEAPAVVAGPATGPVIVPLSPRTMVVGVRLRPGAAQSVLGVPASELVNRDTPLDDIWGAAAGAVSARVSAQPSLAARLRAAEVALGRRLAAAGPLDPAIVAATVWLARHPEGQIEHLARFLEIGERRLRRRFAAAIGYGPKTLQRVLRLQRALKLAGGRARPGARLAMIAAEAGYADQAHMSRELRRSPGAAPRRYCRAVPAPSSCPICSRPTRRRPHRNSREGLASDRAVWPQLRSAVAECEDATPGRGSPPPIGAAQ